MEEVDEREGEIVERMENEQCRKEKMAYFSTSVMLMSTLSPFS